MPFTKIFADDTHNTTLQKQGYTVVPILNAEEIKALTNFFYANHAQLPDGMYASSHAPDFSFRKRRIACKAPPSVSAALRACDER